MAATQSPDGRPGPGHTCEAARHGLRNAHRELVASFELPGDAKEVWLCDTHGRVLLRRTSSSSELLGYSKAMDPILV